MLRLRNLIAAALFCATMHAQSAITTDPPADKAFPATTHTFLLPSHGAQLNALVYIAAGSGPHPVVILLYGFPGNEKNLDLAQAIRRAGWDVLFFNYRGSWGSHGAFSFTNALQDTHAALAAIRSPALAKTLRADPNNIVLIGHSMGGMLATTAAAHDPHIHAIALISAANMAGSTLPAVTAHKEEAAVPRIANSLAKEGIEPLAGCTPESLARDLLAHAAAWNIPTRAPALATRPALIISSDDGLAPATDQLATNLKSAGDKNVTTLHIPTDHSYSDHRIALESAILNWLTTLQ